MSEYCREDETEDDLMRNSYRILQKKDGFRFGLDAVLLSSFAVAGPKDKVLDMGTGCAVIPVLMAAKTGGRDFTGLEIQPAIAGMAQRSVAMNGLEDRIQIINGDCREAGQLFGKASFDIVTANPPYLKDDGPAGENPQKALARHEIALKFSDLARESEKVLKPHGRFYLVHRPERLPEIMDTLISYSLAPRRLRLVYPDIASAAVLFLMEARKGAAADLYVEPPLIICERPGEYSAEVKAIYGLDQTPQSEG